MRTYTLIGPDGLPARSNAPGAFGGHRRTKVYGRLDCAGALRWIERGHYVAHRVFFADEATALAAGFRPCARCLPARYAAWKAGRMMVRITPLAPYDARGVLADRSALARTRPADLPLPLVRAQALVDLAAGRPLNHIKGVGPWTRAYVAMRTGDPDVLLDGDLIVRRTAARLGGPADARGLAALGERWSPFRSYATHHLWAAAAPARHATQVPDRSGRLMHP